MADLREILGHRVRQQRMALGLSQTDLAGLTEIPVQVLSRLEHGKQTIYVERLAALANALAVSADYLLGMSDTPTPPKRPRRPRAEAATPEEGA
jgi:transcriptional regulator with XRE-family HTH domain